jgi:hypothetical protein
MRTEDAARPVPRAFDRLQSFLLSSVILSATEGPPRGSNLQRRCRGFSATTPALSRSQPVPALSIGIPPL